jgi:hypothetical protein
MLQGTSITVSQIDQILENYQPMFESIFNTLMNQIMMSKQKQNAPMIKSIFNLFTYLSSIGDDKISVLLLNMGILT